MVKGFWFYEVILFIRSCIFFVVMISSIVLYGTICICALPFPIEWRHVIAVDWLRKITWALKVICGVNYHVEGLENIPKNRNGIVMSKHQSEWEAFFLPTLFHHAATILKKELLWLPFFGWGVATIKPIAIDLNARSSAMEQVMKQGTECLTAGRWVITYPEGARVLPGEVVRYRLGGARLAVATGYPVIPVAHNSGRFWVRYQFIKRPGTIQVVIGPLIESKNRTAEDLLEEVENWIEETMVKIENPALTGK